MVYMHMYNKHFMHIYEQRKLFFLCRTSSLTNMLLCKHVMITLVGQGCLVFTLLIHKYDVINWSMCWKFC